jgi:hypothetical protein
MLSFLCEVFEAASRSAQVINAGQAFVQPTAAPLLPAHNSAGCER